MNRPWQTWLLFGLCCAVVLAAMGWISITVLRLDRADQEATRRGEIEERVRLALWRMDSALAPWVARESARPYSVYSAFHPIDRAYTHLFQEILHGGALVASPLLKQSFEYIRLHFQVLPDGTFTSPQIPVENPNMLDVAQRRGYTTPEKIKESQRRLLELKSLLSFDALQVAMGPPPPPESPETTPPTHVAAVPRQELEQQEDVAQQQAEPPQPQPREQSRGQHPSQTGQAAQPAQQSDLQMRAQRQAEQITIRQGKIPQQFISRQIARNNSEWQARSANYGFNTLEVSGLGNNPALSAPSVLGDLARPIWIGDELMLVRWVPFNGDHFIQGCWLDWPAIHTWLTGEVKDLLPNGRLEPVRSEDKADTGRMLAGLPVVRLVPGDVPVDSGRPTSPIRISLTIAWGCVLTAALAVAVLLIGTVSLSERRAAFVSAVTHEMRTPLTTFRMYTEMLLKGMIPDEEKRRRYLDTLRAEADRLTHLVANVLAYARLERNSTADRAETVPLSDLVERVRGRLAERAERADMTLVVAASDAAASVNVRADAAAVEQILFNLVDNACKYAASADRRIHLEMDRSGKSAVLRVRDHGPGISRTDARRLFRPFCKSARDAANSAPGVGLGLALSRRLARDMGGRLSLEQQAHEGACFVLALPIA